MFGPNHFHQQEQLSLNRFGQAICGITCGVLFIFLSEKCGWDDKAIGKVIHYLSPLCTMATAAVIPWIARKMFRWYLQHNISKYSSRMSAHISQAADRQAITGEHEAYLKSQRFHADKTLIETYRSLLDATTARFKKHFGDPGGKQDENV